MSSLCMPWDSTKHKVCLLNHHVTNNHGYIIMNNTTSNHMYTTKDYIIVSKSNKVANNEKTKVLSPHRN